jgi:hypothetical protein
VQVNHYGQCTLGRVLPWQLQFGSKGRHNKSCTAQIFRVSLAATAGVRRCSIRREEERKRSFNGFEQNEVYPAESVE